MTKSELNLRLPVPLAPGKLKKTPLAELEAMVAALPPAQVLDDSEQLTPTKKTREARIAAVSRKVPVKPRVIEDGVLFAPRDERKDPKPGSKRALIIAMLREGTSVDEIASATGWTSIASSAIYGEVKMTGYGVERRNGRLHLLPGK